MRAIFIPSRRQQVWGWPALINFSVASSGAALFLFEVTGYITGLLREPGRSLADWLAPLLLVGGMAPLALEAGRPGRVRYILSNLRTSWMSRESLAAMVFLPTSVLHLIWPGSFWTMLAGVAAASFIFSQAMIIQRCRAVTAWSAKGVVPYLICSSLSTGAGLWLGVRLWETPGSAQVNTAMMLTVGVILVELLARTYYLRLNQGPGFDQSTCWLRQRSVYLVGIGRVLPVALLTTAVLLSLSGSFWAWIVPVAVSATIAVTIVEKVGLLRYCGYLREIGLPMAPASRRPLASVLHGT